MQNMCIEWLAVRTSSCKTQVCQDRTRVEDQRTNGLSNHRRCVQAYVQTVPYMGLGEHRSDISRKILGSPAGGHFNKKGHHVTDLIATPIERVFPKDCQLTRKRRETYWISQYDSVSFGANKKA